MVLDKLRPSKLLLEKKKYKFYKYKIEFLGFIVGRSGIKINPEKI